MSKYQLGNLNFKTWNEVHKFAQDILNKSPGTLAGVEFNFVKDLIEYHPNIENKLKNGIKLIRVGKPEYGTGNAFLIIDNNDILQDISYKKCRPIAKKNKNKAIEKDIKAQITKAYREAVENDIKNYWQSHTLKVCSQCNSNKNIHTDHIKPFIELVNEYKTLNNVTEHPKIERINGNIHTFRFSASTEKNRVFIDGWKNYHSENSTFQFLCRSCNLRKHSSGKKYRQKI